MKFKSYLTEGIWLKRYYRFLLLSALKDQRKLMIKCPNLQALENCEVLGSRIWFSNPMPLTSEYLHTLEIVEIDQGGLVFVNENHVNYLVHEALSQGRLPHLGQGKLKSTIIQLGPEVSILGLKFAHEHPSLVLVHPLYYADPLGQGRIKAASPLHILGLKKLIALKRLGQRAVLIFSCQNTLINAVSPLSDQGLFAELIAEAIQLGVEIYAYKVNINFTEVKLESFVPILGTAIRIRPMI